MENPDLFVPENPKISGVSETEQIVKHVLEKLDIHQPKTEESRLISVAMDKMPPEDREKALKMFRAVYEEYFDHVEDKMA